ncbi:hypothetical protein G9A89_015466, partial [Geosiphon pyriformis]
YHKVCSAALAVLIVVVCVCDQQAEFLTLHIDNGDIRGKVGALYMSKQIKYLAANKGYHPTSPVLHGKGKQSGEHGMEAIHHWNQLGKQGNKKPEDIAKLKPCNVTLCQHTTGHKVESMKQLNEFKEELGLVGAGVGGGFQTTDELRPIMFDKAMSSPDHKAWQEAINKEMQKLKD